MAENKFQNPQEEKVEEDTNVNPSPKDDMEHVADKLAKKSGKSAHEDRKNEDEFTI